MPMPRDPGGSAAVVQDALERVRRRTGVQHVVRAATSGLAAFAVVLVLAMLARGSMAMRLGMGAGAAAAAGVFVIARMRHARTHSAAAAAVERTYPSLRNLAVTAVELLADPERTRPYMWNRVMQAAAQSLTAVDAARVIPFRRDVIALMTVGVLAVASVVLVGRTSAADRIPAAVARQERSAVASGDILVDITPPSYTGRAPLRLRNPSSIDALAASVAVIRVAGASRLAVRINGSAIPAEGDSARATLAESGYIAIDAGDVHRLLPLTVTPDAAPDVRVTAPGKDLRVADAKATIPIHAAATDDLALRDLELRYTIVSGGGEQYSFKEGTLPANVVKDSSRAWTAAAALSLAALKLEPGDALIYRAVAADARPGAAGEASSDTYFVEVAGPGDVPLEGVDMPPDRERYALSQAMIVLKIQRLIAREPGMARADVEESAATIGAEQRTVRANFVFLLGGEVEDEVVEAEASHEIQEGRLANQARREIVAATLAMQKVEQALAAVSTRAALPPAQEAVRALQRAFGRSRYLLRALPARVRLDPSRRLSGDLTSARDWSRALVPPSEDRVVAATRRAIAEAASIAAARQTSDTGPRLERLAEDVLAAIPGDAGMQAAARSVLLARDRFASGDADGARAALQEAVAPLLPRAQHGRIDVPGSTRDAARLAGAAASSGRGAR